MLERDYIMRLIRQFMEALEKLMNENANAKAKGTNLQMEFDAMYRTYLHQPSSFFYEQDITSVLAYLQSAYPGKELLPRIEMLSDLLYSDALYKSTTKEKEHLSTKALYFLQYLDERSDTFSFDRRDKIYRLKHLLNR